MRLFDVNANFGCGANSRPDFSSVSDLISHMDYLEIDRSLVWHTMARDLNPTIGNKRLMTEITATPENRKRLVPAFVASPVTFYESGALAHLKDKLKSESKAVRIFPGTCRFQLAHIERVLKEIVEYRPVLFWDFRDRNSDSDIKDLLELTKVYPDVTVVCTQMMWGCFGMVLDAMWRRKNIYVDTSWLHMRGTIEMLVANFGPERVLFGTGLKTHYGAAVSALAHSQIDERAKELIAHGNLERLLDLDLVKGKSLCKKNDLIEKKPLWNLNKNGLPVVGVDIIDAHAHSNPLSPGWFFEDNSIEHSAQNLISVMDRVGVNQSIISSCAALFSDPVEFNRITEQQMEPHANRIKGYLAYNPLYEEHLVPLLDKFFQNRFWVGFKILGEYWNIPLDDPRFEVVWKYANDHVLPVLIHTWASPYSSPSLLKNIVGKYPAVTFILGHSGGNEQGRVEAEMLALENKNVILEFCGSFCGSFSLEQMMERVGSDRVVFGSDAVAHDLAWELGRLLSQPVPDELLTPVLSENMKRILAKYNSSKI